MCGRELYSGSLDIWTETTASGVDWVKTTLLPAQSRGYQPIPKITDKHRKILPERGNGKSTVHGGQCVVLLTANSLDQSPGISIHRIASYFLSSRGYALDLQNRVLEMTESGIAKRDVSLRDAFGRIRVLGIKPAMDDFNTGYSLLDILKSSPVR